MTPQLADTLSKRDKQRIAILCITLIICASCLPLLLSYTPFDSHHDLKFHLYRIDGIAEGLRDGQFPVRIQTTQIKGMGYPVSICYGDLFLYIPAALRLLGMSVKGAYSIFIVLVNTFTAIVSCIVFKRMSGSTSVALVATALWTWSPYRLLDDVWPRGAVGEFLALSFFPMVLYGIYSIFFSDRRGASKLGWLWCALGISGVVYSHILSTLLLIIAFVPLGLYLLFRHHDRKVLGAIVLTLVVTLLLCLAFVIPFLDYYLNADMRVTSSTLTAKRAKAEAHAIQPAQLLFFLPGVSFGSAPDNTTKEMPFSMGWAALLGVIIWLGCCAIPLVRDRMKRGAMALGIFLTHFTALLAFCTTCYFPWGTELGSLADKVIGTIATIQFPWRFIGPITFFIVTVGVLALMTLRKVSPVASRISCALIALVAGFEVLFGLTSFMTNASAMPIDYHKIDQAGIMGGEYLPYGVDPKEIMDAPDNPIYPDNLIVHSYTKQGTSARLEVSAQTTDASLTVPLLCYPHYVAKLENGAELPIRRGDFGLISFTIPAGYDGTVDVRFEVPTLWSIAVAASALTLIACVIVVIRTHMLSYMDNRGSNPGTCSRLSGSRGKSSAARGRVGTKRRISASTHET